MAIRDSYFGVSLYGSQREIVDDFAGADAPKLKFNFTISLEYNTELAGRLNPASFGSDDPYSIAFGIKQTTRPSPNIIYEDVNFYNFMTKIATKVDFGVMTVTLYDDRNNRAHDIFKNYMEIVSPATERDRSQAPILDRFGQSTSSLLGPLQNGERHGPIKNIRITHFTNSLGRKVIYDFLNPKIQNVTPDELDMTQSDVSTITFTFVYDTYNVTTENGSSSQFNPELVRTTTQSANLPDPPTPDGISPIARAGGISSLGSSVITRTTPLENLPEE